MNENADRILVLLRHAKSAWPDVPDHERPLARRGQRDAPVMGRWLRAAGYVPDLVLCSTARRARETWQLAQAELGAAPQVRYSGGVYEAAPADLIGLARKMASSVRVLLIVGHNPAMEELALDLASGEGATAAMALDRMRAKFPTAAVAVLDVTGGWAGLSRENTRLARFVTPRDIAAEGHPQAGT
jgi:phosphohistidine phosphatase